MIRFRPGSFAGLGLAGDQGFAVIAVHLADEVVTDVLRAHCFTFAVIRATAEVFVHHRHHHAESSLVALGLTPAEGS